MLAQVLENGHKIGGNGVEMGPGYIQLISNNIIAYLESWEIIIFGFGTWTYCIWVFWDIYFIIFLYFGCLYSGNLSST